MRHLASAASAAVLLFAAAAPAVADDSWEFRLGVTRHDLVRSIEDGPNLTIGVLAPSPDALSWAFSPRPYLYGSFNLSGRTNFGVLGLAWTIPLTDRFSAELAGGVAYHDGVKDFDRSAPPDDPTRIRLASTRALLGSRVLFHSSLGLDYALTDTMRVGVYYEHLSHGQILGNGRNQALDNAGVRVGWRF
ncbi:MAG: acyloxyacyl hydrolase [Maricaulaceae bacterium]|nr:acyloxyacyl hydrolase [Maricaulaceae bacterium]